MSERQKTIITVGLLSLLGLFIIITAKGLNQGAGGVGSAIANAISSIISDISYILIGMAVAAVGFFLPPPIDILVIIFGVLLIPLLFVFDGVSNNNNS